MASDEMLVIGGGIIGCAIAAELAGRGTKVTVIERQTIGAEASNAAAGILGSQIELKEPGPLLELCLMSRACFPALVRELEGATGIALDYRTQGILAVALTAEGEQHLVECVAWQRRAGLRAEPLTAAEVHRLEPAIDGPVRRGVLFPDDHQVDNAALTQAYAALATQRGAHIETGTDVTGYLCQGGALRGVVVGKVHRPVRRAIIATGAWAGVARQLPFAIPVLPARGQIFTFRASTPLVQHTIKGEGMYLVPRTSGQLLLGSTVEFVGFQKAVTEDARVRLLEAARAILSGVATLPPETAWSGLRPYSEDRLPILGPTPIEGLFIATGHFRNGILLAPITAQIMADLLILGRSPIDLTPFLLDRFR